MEPYQVLKMKKWIPLKLLDNHSLCVNPNAIEFLEQCPERICCKICLSTNPGAIPFLRKNPQVINWLFLALNPEGISLIEENFEFIESTIFGNDDFDIEEILKENHPGLGLTQKRFIQRNRSHVQQNKESERVFWSLLSLNPNSISFLEKHLDKIDWKALMYNKNALPLFQKRPSKIDWSSIGLNPNFIQMIETLNPQRMDEYFWSLCSLAFIEKNLDRVNWIRLSENPNAILILKKYPEKICFNTLCRNPNPEAISILNENIKKIKNWSALTKNPSALPILEKNIDDINWVDLCSNPNAVTLFLQYPEKIKIPCQWKQLCMNPNAHLLIPLFEQNLESLNWFHLCAHPQMEKFIKKHADKVDWQSILFNRYKSHQSIWILETYIKWIPLTNLPKWKDEDYKKYRKLSWKDISENPNIFKYDLEKLRLRSDPYREELIAMAYHPARISYWKSVGYDLEKCI